MTPSDRQTRIRAVVDAYFAEGNTSAVERDRELLARHADLMPELESEVRKRRIILVAMDEADSAAPATPNASVLGPLTVRCPDCRQSTDVSDDTRLSAIVCSGCGSSFSLVGTAEESPDAVHPTRVAHFELLEQLGVGAFGAVWKARDTVLNRDVALKFPRRGHLTEVEQERFMREARAAAQLDHPHIVTVFEIGREGEKIFMASALIDGVPLSEKNAEGHSRARDAARMCQKIASALHYAHEAGIVHRDLKPSNILVDRAGEPHITDFGLAKSEADVSMTMDGNIIGTPAYMSPEQAAGDTHRADRRSDVYSLGVVLYELLTGELPFKGNWRMQIHQVIHEEPRPPSELNHTIPRDLETICLKCLEKQPNRRYPSAAEVAGELDRFLGDLPIRARPVGPVERQWRWIRRNPVTAMLVGSVLLLLVAVAVVSTVGFVGADTERRRAERASHELRESFDNTARALVDAQRSTAEMYVHAGATAGARGPDAEAALWFASAARLPRLDERQVQRNMIRAREWSRDIPFPIAAVRHECGEEEIRELVLHPHRSDNLVTIDTDNDARIWDMKNGRSIEVSGAETMYTATWNRAGDRLAVGCAGKVVVAGFPSLEIRHSISVPGECKALAFTHDDLRLAIGTTSVRIWNCLEGAFGTDAIEQDRRVRFIRFDSSDRHMVVTGNNGEVRVYELSEADEPRFRWSTSHHFWSESNHGAHPFPPVFEFGDSALIVSKRDELGLVRIRDGRMTPLGMGGREINEFTRSADGGFLAISVQGGTGKFMSGHLAARGSFKLGAESRLVSSLAFSPDGRLLATSADKTVRIWSVPDLRELCDPLQQPHRVLHVAFSPDGRYLLTAQSDGLVRMWAFPASDPARLRIPASGQYTFATLSPDGKHLMPTGMNGRQTKMTATSVFDVRSGKPMGREMRPRGVLLEARFSPRGDRVATIDSVNTYAQRQKAENDGGHLDQWNWRTGRRVRESIEFRGAEPRSLDYSPDGRSLAVLLSSGELHVHDTSGSENPRRWKVPNHANDNNVWFRNGVVEYGPHGRRVVIWSGSQIGRQRRLHVLDAGTGKVLRSLRARRYFGFSNDGRYLVFDTGVMDIGTLEVVASFEHPGSCHNTRFDAEARFVVAAAGSATRVLDWRAGDLSFPVMNHDNTQFDACFSPDSEYVFSTGDTNSIDVWCIEDGYRMTPPLRLSSNGYQVSVAPDGEWVIGAGESKAIDVHDLGFLDPVREVSAEVLGQWLEIVSGKQMVEGNRLHEMTSDEWLSRFRTFRQRHKDFSAWDESTHAPTVHAALMAGESVSRRILDGDLVHDTSLWRYSNDDPEEGSRWRETVFDDSSWRVGFAPFGYGNEEELGERSAAQQTYVGFGDDSGRKPITVRFRQGFDVERPEDVRTLVVGMVRDDGIALYLNGTEIARQNLPPDAGPRTAALEPVLGVDEYLWRWIAVDPSHLRAGRNVLAAEVHQNSPSSSDMRFDLCLRSNVVPLLERILKDRDSHWRERWDAMDLAGQLGGRAETLVPSLVALLRDEDPLTREIALDSLSRIDERPDLVVPAVLALSDDSDEVVVEKAAALLGFSP